MKVDEQLNAIIALLPVELQVHNDLCHRNIVRYNEMWFVEYVDKELVARLRYYGTELEQVVYKFKNLLIQEGYINEICT